MENNKLKTSTADDNIENLLKIWKLEHLQNHFIEHRITHEVLSILTPRQIEILFQGLAVGDMAIFQKNLTQWQLESNNAEKTPKTNTTLEFTDCGLVKKPVPSVKDMLMDSQNGRLLLKHYAKHNLFNEQQRNLLINTLAKYIESKGYPCSLADSDEIENQICVLFPTESKDYYTSGKRGRLYNKIYNLKRYTKSLTKENEPICGSVNKTTESKKICSRS
ncbi:uncharacterized protein LOC131805681 [Musca domestica]|uniref:Uncharacterized protein LOC131805681 n=1 Tax=Musca domestica TaxID=7370 RepID=A0ABM3VHB0_MUSDO|nr:uncharacterized protein LOC131805681 [Musca domestica]